MTMSSSTSIMARRVIYNDPRRFGFMLLVATHASSTTHKLFRGLGVEPLNGALDAAFLARAFRATRGAGRRRCCSTSG